ncbi:hypothetical protein PNOK_0971900 [Pyrrhoderma noxium]|uniref:Uncharacterized protein n=1 Tax=Pyrrhoderma noxium TaxID=2282107 RepID=A0A286U4W8_9AGAM|nr:hypothetical protein PNOK_0971900 [Pyrrhoderma noxium]
MSTLPGLSLDGITWTSSIGIFSNLGSSQTNSTGNIAYVPQMAEISDEINVPAEDLTIPSGADPRSPMIWTCVPLY